MIVVAPRTVCFTAGDADMSRLVSEEFAGTCSKVAKVPRYAVDENHSSFQDLSIEHGRKLVLREVTYYRQEKKTIKGAATMQTHRRAFACTRIVTLHQGRCEKCKNEVAFYENRTHI